MNKTPIEWVRNPDGSQGYTWNPITGCLNHDNDLCKGGGFPCYAFKLANTRLKPLYLANRNVANWQTENGVEKVKMYNDPFYPRFWEERLEAMQPTPYRRRFEPFGTFVCDMGDLFGIGIPEEWTNRTLDAIRRNGYDRFYILTKQAARLPEFSPFPENCWVGVTATNAKMLKEALIHLEEIKASVKYVSLEPLLEQVYKPVYFLNALQDFLPVIDWLIIGACTGTRKEVTTLARNNNPFLTEMPWGKKWTAQPNPEWVREIVEAADKAGIKVFLKNNLNPLFAENDCAGFNQYKDQLFTIVDNFPTRHHLRQELPA